MPLVLFEYYMLKFTLTVTGDLDLQRTKFRFDCFPSVSVFCVINPFVAVVVPAVAKFMFKFGFEHLFDKLAVQGLNCFLSTVGSYQIVLLDEGRKLFFGKYAYH